MHIAQEAGELYEVLTFELHTLSISLHDKLQKHATKLVLQHPDTLSSNFTSL